MLHFTTNYLFKKQLSIAHCLNSEEDRSLIITCYRDDIVSKDYNYGYYYIKRLGPDFSDLVTVHITS